MKLNSDGIYLDKNTYYSYGEKITDISGLLSRLHESILPSFQFIVDSVKEKRQIEIDQKENPILKKKHNAVLFKNYQRITEEKTYENIIYRSLYNLYKINPERNIWIIDDDKKSDIKIFIDEPENKKTEPDYILSSKNRTDGFSLTNQKGEVLISQDFLIDALKSKLEEIFKK